MKLWTDISIIEFVIDVLVFSEKFRFGHWSFIGKKRNNSLSEQEMNYSWCFIADIGHQNNKGKLKKTISLKKGSAVVFISGKGLM